MTNSFSFVCAVTKMRSLVSTGDECPAGSSVFQTTFLAGPNSVGRPLVSETPLPFGPRNCDHSSEAAMVKGNAIKITDRRAMFFSIFGNSNLMNTSHLASAQIIAPSRLQVNLCNLSPKGSDPMKTILFILVITSSAIAQRPSTQKGELLFDFRKDRPVNALRISAATQRNVLSKVFRRYLTD